MQPPLLRAPHGAPLFLSTGQADRTLTMSVPSPRMATSDPDFLILGAGIAGASIGHFLSPHGRCVMLERESQPGYHSTGPIGGAVHRQLRAAAGAGAVARQRAVLSATATGVFADAPLLQPRGLLTVAGEDELPALEEAWAVLQQTTRSGQWLTSEQACAMVPALRPEKVRAAILEPDSFDMDVHAIHQGYLRGYKRAGGELVTDADVVGHRAGGRAMASAHRHRRGVRGAGADQRGGRLVRRGGRRWRVWHPSAWCPSGAAPSPLRHRPAWTRAAGRWCWRRTSRFTSSPTPARCWPRP